MHLEVEAKDRHPRNTLPAIRGLLRMEHKLRNLQKKDINNFTNNDTISKKKNLLYANELEPETVEQVDDIIRIWAIFAVGLLLY